MTDARREFHHRLSTQLIRDIQAIGVEDLAVQGLARTRLVLLMSLVREPHRRRLNAVMVAGAGAACLSGGGLGGREFAFTALATESRCGGPMSSGRR